MSVESLSSPLSHRRLMQEARNRGEPLETRDARCSGKGGDAGEVDAADAVGSSSAHGTALVTGVVHSCSSSAGDAGETPIEKKS